MFLAAMYSAVLPSQSLHLAGPGNVPTIAPRWSHPPRVVLSLLLKMITNERLTRSGRRLQKQLSHTYFRESSARMLLSFEVSKTRKRTLEDEGQETAKRLRKRDDKRTWDTTEIIRARGYTAEETAGYIDVLPNRALIYNVEEEPNT
jgi:hypothetical protein